MADATRAASIAAALDHPRVGGAARCGRVRTACDRLFRPVDGYRSVRRRSPDSDAILADRIDRRSAGPFGKLYKNSIRAIPELCPCATRFRDRCLALFWTIELHPESASQFDLQETPRRPSKDSLRDARCADGRLW